MMAKATFPESRIGNLVERRTPREIDHPFALALDNIESWTGHLLDRPGPEGVGVRSGNYFEPGDVLFGKLRPYLAKAWASDRAGVYIGDFLCLVPRGNASSRFLSYVLRTRDFIQRAAACSYGSKMPRIEWDSFKTLDVPAPTPSEQRTIADYLDHETAEIDAFIADLRRVTALTDLRLEASLTTLLSRVSRWVPLARVARLFTGSTPSSSLNLEAFDPKGTPWIRPGDIDLGERNAQASQRLSTVGASHARPLKGPGVLVVGIGATVGRVGFVQGTFATNQQITTLLPRGVHAEYLYYAMRSLGDYMRKTAHGNTLPIVNNSQLGALRVPLPNAIEQEHIATQMDNEMEQTRETNRVVNRAIALAQERRAALISAAVTGQIDVTKRRRPVAEVLEDEVLERV